MASWLAVPEAFERLPSLGDNWYCVIISEHNLS
jgi:hypothetical protein